MCGQVLSDGTTQMRADLEDRSGRNWPHTGVSQPFGCSGAMMPLHLVQQCELLVLGTPSSIVVEQ